MNLGEIARAFLDFCYPGACAACGAGFEGSALLCAACLEEQRRLEASAACPRCALPLAAHGLPCPHCAGAGAAHFERIVRLCPFHGPARDLIHAMKYRRAWRLAEQLADRLLEADAAKALLSETDVLAPVPLHRRRQTSRGYDQAAVVARRLGRRCGLPVARPLLRLRNTPTQTHQHSRARREANLRDAFALIAPRAVTGRHVVLVDDVMTTGATLHAAARALLPASPASLSAIVLCVADPRGIERHGR